MICCQALPYPIRQSMITWTIMCMVSTIGTTVRFKYRISIWVKNACCQCFGLSKEYSKLAMALINQTTSINKSINLYTLCIIVFKWIPFIISKVLILSINIKVILLLNPGIHNWLLILYWGLYVCKANYNALVYEVHYLCLP